MRKLGLVIAYHIVNREYNRFCKKHICSKCFMQEEDNRCCIAMVLAWLEREIKRYQKMTDEERIEMKMQYIHKIAQAKGISYQEAYKLAIVKEYLKYADTVTEINRQ